MPAELKHGTIFCIDNEEATMNPRYCLAIAIAALAGNTALSAQTLTYFGRATIKIVTAENFVIYVDPYADGDYAQKADLVLVTHGHTDHNAVELVTMKDKAVIAAPSGAVSRAAYRAVKEGDKFSVGSIQIQVVPAYNKNHERSSSVGYLVSFDGLTVYHAGDTNYIPEMENLASMAVDYALLPTDGVWNMGGAEAGRCVDVIKPRFAIAIHSSGSGLYNKSNAAKLSRPQAILLEPGKTMPLTKK